MENIKIAAAYIRVSTEDQTEFSPAAQLRELQEYAVSHGYLLDTRYVYSDEGISGRSAEKRPGFMKMISDAKSREHPFDVILVHKFDRFARSREDSIVYKSMLKKVGVEVISIKEPLAEGSYSGVMEAIYESFAEAYSINLGQEVRKGMTEKALRGEPQTAPPFGYRLENKKFYPHETEAAIVREIFESFASGGTFFGIAKSLNDRGIRTHRGTRFENRTVEYILRNPVYIGYLRWNPKRKSKRKIDDPDILTVRGQHEPIIDKDLWETVQSRVAELKSRWSYHARPNYDRKHWLCGIVRCAACNATLVYTQPHFLKCGNYIHGRCIHSQHIHVDKLATAVISRLRDDISSTIPPSYHIVRTKEFSDQTLQGLRQTVSRIEKKIERLTDAYLNEALSLEDYKLLKGSLQSELSESRSALEAALSATEQQAAASPSALKDAILKVLVTLESDASIAQKYDALNSIVDHCTFDRENSLLSITYRLTV